MCAHAAYENECACSAWLMKGGAPFDPSQNCEACSCTCDVIRAVRLDAVQRVEAINPEHYCYDHDCDY